MTHFLPTVVLAAFSLTVPLSAGIPQTWHVAAGADPATATGSLQMPFASIQVAIQAASAGDTIEIGPGTYSEADILVDRSLILRGAGPNATVINAGSQDRVLLFNSNATFFEVEGLTLTGGRCADSEYGGGLAVNGPTFGTIRDVRFRENVAGRSGGGLLVVGTAGGCTLTLDRCEFIDNTALGVNHNGQGGAIWCGQDNANVLVRNSLFDGNWAEVTGMAITVQNPGHTFDVVNCTFVNHALSDTGNDVLFRVAGLPIVRIQNSVFGQNESLRVSGSTAFASIRHSLIGSMTLSGIDDAFGNDTGVPTFADAANDDYRLAAGSLGIDAGDGTLVELNEIDIDLAGRPRRFDDQATADTGVGVAPIVDMGCYEYLPAGAVTELGGACATATGVAPLLGTSTATPSIGEGLDLSVLSPGSTSAFAGFGFTQLGAPAGIDLAVIGAPSCILHCDLLLPLPVTPDGTPTTLAIANDLNLVGMPFYLQGVVIHPGSNDLGLALSHGYRGVFGYPM